MKFIKFANTLLNLEQVALIDKVVKDLDKGPFHVEVWLLNVGMKTTIGETFQTITEMLDRFQELSDLLLEPEHVSKGRVMTAGEAAKLPDIVGKRLRFEMRVSENDKSTVPLRADLIEGSQDCLWFDENELIEVLD